MDDRQDDPVGEGALSLAGLAQVRRTRGALTGSPQAMSRCCAQSVPLDRALARRTGEFLDFALSMLSRGDGLVARCGIAQTRTARYEQIAQGDRFVPPHRSPVGVALSRHSVTLSDAASGRSCLVSRGN